MTCLQFFQIACLFAFAKGFSPLSLRPAFGSTRPLSYERSTSLLHMVDPINLAETISDNHEAEGARLSASIAGYLDLEWCPQEVHVQMGESAKRSYITAREAGNHEIMAIMTQVSDDLEKNWGKYDKDAFVNAWDIGNYVSDYLIARSGGESCDCNAAIFNPDEP